MQASRTLSTVTQLSTPMAASLCAAVGAILFNALPAFVGAVAESLNYSNAQLGSIVSSYFIGHTIMTIVMGLTLRRYNLHLAARLFTSLTALCFFLAMFVNDYQVMLVILFLAGIGGGSLFVFSMAVLTLSARATRNIGLAFFSQLALGGLTVYLCSALITPSWGISGVACLLGLLFLCTVVFLTGVFKRQEVITAVQKQPEESMESVTFAFRLRPTVILLMLTIFFAGMTAVWTFIERIGNSAGFSPSFLGTVLMVALLLGCVASLITIVLDNRVGLRLPIGVCCVMGVGSMLLLQGAGLNDASAYAASAFAFQFAWVLAVNYIAAGVAYFDDNGSHAPLLPASMGIGIIIGPSIAGLLSERSFVPVMQMGITVIVLVALVLVLLPLLKGVR